MIDTLPRATYASYSLLDMWAKQKTSNTRHQYSGFTIVELLIVIVVIGILAAITIVAYRGVQSRAQAAAVSSALQQTSKKLALYAVDNGAFPVSLATVGISNASGVAYQYSVNNAITPQTYCVTATNGTTSYNVTSTTSPSNGGCAGHGVGGVAAITNTVVNPSFETNLTDWSTGNATLTQTTSWASSGTNSIVVTPNNASSSDSYITAGGGQGGMRMGMVAGGTYTLSARLNIPVSLTGSTDPLRAARITAWQNAGGYSYQSAGGNTSAGDYSLSVTFTLAAGATEAFIRLYNGALQGGGAVRYDSVMLTSGPNQYTYADGASSGWVWNGTANASTSTGPPL